MIPEDHFEFLHAVWTRRSPFAFVFLGINITVFLLMALAGGSANEPALMAFGVKSNTAIAAGQWWRFVTPVFIHIGLLHLLFNSYALWMVGPQVEKLYGGARFVILYVLTGIAGVAGSYFYHPDIISAGASGAIFGLFGVLLVFGIRYRNSIPPFFKQAVGTGILPVVLINLIIGFTVPGIDNAAHIGGLLSGAALAALLPFQRPGEETDSFSRSVQVALLAGVAVCFIEVAIHYDGPNLSVRNAGRSITQIFGTGSTTTEFIDAINNMQKTFEASVDELQSGRLDRLASFRDDTAKSIDQLRSIPSLSPTADSLTSGLLRIMQDQYELMQDIDRSRTFTFAQDRRLKENVDRYNSVMAEFSKWVEDEGRRHGIQKGRGR